MDGFKKWYWSFCGHFGICGINFLLGLQGSLIHFKFGIDFTPDYPSQFFIVETSNVTEVQGDQ